MRNHEVIPGFDILLDEINEVVSELNQQGAHLFSQEKYDEARILIEKVKSITEIRDEIQLLENKWSELKIPKINNTIKTSKKEKHKTKERLKPGLRTQEDDLKIPLLKTLAAMGGAGKVSDVLDQMEQIVKPILTEHDLKSLSSTNELRWRNTTKWARAEMVKEGLLRNDSPYGVWEIAEKGKRLLEQNSINNYKNRKSSSTNDNKKTWLVPITLSTIVDVVMEMSVNNDNFNKAAKSVAKARKLRSVSTIYDKCTRRIGLNVDQFLSLTKNKKKLIDFLIEKFPDQEDYVIYKLKK